MKQQQQTYDLIRFDRHEVYTKEMLTQNMDLISPTCNWSSINNSLYGLFDGYLYPELQDRTALLESGLLAETVDKIIALTTEITNLLKK